MRAAATTCAMYRPRTHVQGLRRNADLTRISNLNNRRPKRNDAGDRLAAWVLIRRAVVPVAVV
jgi:hypothetical protein